MPSSFFRDETLDWPKIFFFVVRIVVLIKIDCILLKIQTKRPCSSRLCVHSFTELTVAFKAKVKLKHYVNFLNNFLSKKFQQIKKNLECNTTFLLDISSDLKKFIAFHY